MNYCKPRKVISKKVTADALGVSLSTLARMDASGEGPKRIQLSKRRVGYFEDEVLSFQQACPRVK